MMIIAGGSRSSARFWTWHLQRTDSGQSVSIRDAVGLMGQDMGEWFSQMEAMSLGGKTENYFYHFNLNPREDEALTPEQIKVAVATTLENLGLEGQPYFLVEHDKDGRSPHYHCIVLRVDLDTGKAISDSHNYAIHMRTADELEQRFDQERTERGRGPDGPNPKGYEVQRGKETGIDPKAVAVELKALWHQADTGQAFAAALAAHGYILANGDRRDFVVVDAGGNEHSLGRRVGAKAAEARARMADVDRDALPTVAEARALARERAAERRDRDEATAPDLPAAAESREKSRSAVTDQEPPVPLSEFDRHTAERFDALRAAPSEEDFIREGIDWQARQSGTPLFSDRPADGMPTAFERVTRATFTAVRDNGGEPVTRDGEGFWHRAISALAEAAERAARWVREAAQGFVGRLMQQRDPDRDDHQRER
jgi:hypothetical protein